MSHDEMFPEVEKINPSHPSWKVRDYSNLPNAYCYPRIGHRRSGLMAGVGRTFGSAVTIEESFCMSGSGKGAFGETKDWPCIHFHMQFPEDRIDARTKFAEQLKTFVDDFMKKEGLEGNPNA